MLHALLLSLPAVVGALAPPSSRVGTRFVLSRCVCDWHPVVACSDARKRARSRRKTRLPTNNPQATTDQVTIVHYEDLSEHFASRLPSLNQFLGFPCVSLAACERVDLTEEACRTHGLRMETTLCRQLRPLIFVCLLWGYARIGVSTGRSLTMSDVEILRKRTSPEAIGKQCRPSCAAAACCLTMVVAVAVVVVVVAAVVVVV